MITRIEFSHSKRSGVVVLSNGVLLLSLSHSMDSMLWLAGRGDNSHHVSFGIRGMSEGHVKKMTPTFMPSFPPCILSFSCGQTQMTISKN